VAEVHALVRQKYDLVRVVVAEVSVKVAVPPAPKMVLDDLASRAHVVSFFSSALENGRSMSMRRTTAWRRPEPRRRRRPSRRAET
jgi:hypothetical protein